MGPPASWEIVIAERERGGGIRWAWLPTGEPWYAMTPEPFGLAVEFPRLTGVRPKDHHGFGPPRMRDWQPKELCTVALEIDVLGRSFRSYGAEVRPANKDPRTTVRYQLTQARAMLADEGVVPWAAFDAGAVPAEWWRTEAFIIAIDEWAGAAAWRDVERLAERAGRSAFSRVWSPTNL
jgi:hypothetical protein